MRKSTRQTIGRVLALLFAVGITVLIALNRDKVEQFKLWGYPGIFLAALAGSATVIFPVPHLAFTFAMGSVLNPWLVGLLAGLGDTFGELTGYMTGYALEEVADDFKLYKRLEHWMEVRGGLTLFILAVIPNPVFDMASMIGGLAGFPVFHFMVVTWAGKTLKALGFAWAGYFGLRWLMQVFG
jgi:membrane protein DedA with SNARE-associated domain